MKHICFNKTNRVKYIIFLLGIFSIWEKIISYIFCTHIHVHTHTHISTHTLRLGFDLSAIIEFRRVPFLMESLKAGNKTDLFLFKDMNQRGAEVWEIDHTSYVKRFHAYRIGQLVIPSMPFFVAFLSMQNSVI